MSSKRATAWHRDPSTEFELAFQRNVLYTNGGNSNVYFIVVVWVIALTAVFVVVVVPVIAIVVIGVITFHL